MAGKSAVVSVIVTGAAEGVKKAFAEAEKAGSNWAAGMGKAALAVGASLAAAGVAIGAGLFKIGSDFDNMVDTIRVGTGATGDALEDLSASAKNVLKTIPADFDAVGKAIADVNTRLGLTGEPLEQVSKQFIELSRITETDLGRNIEVGTAALNGFGIAADKQSEALDTLFKVSQATGISFDRLATDLGTSGVVLRQAGLSFEESAALLGVLNKAGLQAADVIPGLARAMAAAAKEGKPAQQVIEETFAAIRDAPTDTEAAGKALEVFGARGGPKLAALIREGKLSYEQLVAAIADSDETILGAAADTNDWGEKLQVLKNKVLVALEPLATRVFDAVGAAIEKVTPFVEDLAEWFSDNLPKAVKRVEPVVQAFGRILAERVAPALRTVGQFLQDRVLPALVGLGRWLTEHREVLIGVAAAISVGLVAAFVSWAAAAASAAAATIAATWPILAIGAAIAALVAGVIYAYENWDWFRNTIDKVAAFIKDTLIPAVQDIASWIADTLVPAIQTAVSWLIDHLEPVFRAVADVITNFVIPGIQKGISWFQSLRDKIAQAFGWVRDNWPLLLGIITGPIGWAVTIVTRYWDDIKHGFSAVRDWIRDRIEDVVGFFIGLPGRIGGAVSGMFNGIKTAFVSAVNSIISAWNRLEFTIGGGTYDPLGRFGPTITVPAFTFRTPDIPLIRLAEGAIVRARPGGIMANIAEAGRDEAVIPLPRGWERDGIGGGGDTITVNIYNAGSVISERDLVRKVKDGVIAARARGAVT